jgi:H+/Cl- antiporter ClcA
MDRPNRPAQPSAVEIVLWQVCGVLVGAAGAAAFVTWTYYFGVFNSDWPLPVMLGGPLLGGVLGTVWGLRRG